MRSTSPDALEPSHTGDAPHAGHEQIATIAATIRAAIEPGLPPCPRTGRAMSSGACLHASVMLAAALLRFTGAGVMIRGGGAPFGGVRDTAGIWRGHYWVETSATPDEAWVVDITADQFGWTPVRIVPVSEARSAYRRGEQTGVDAAARLVAIELGLCPNELGLGRALRPESCV